MVLLFFFFGGSFFLNCVVFLRFLQGHFGGGLKLFACFCMVVRFLFLLEGEARI